MSLSTKSIKGVVVKTLKVFGLFLVFYTGSLAIISASTAQGKLSIPFFTDTINLPDLWRQLLFKTSEVVLRLFGYETDSNNYIIGIKNGASARLVYSCLAYYYHSWCAAIVTGLSIGLWRSFFWFFLGTFLLFGLNIVRIVALLLIYNSRMQTWLFGIDHHNIFDFFAYTLLITFATIIVKTNNTHLRKGSTINRPNKG